MVQEVITYIIVAFAVGLAFYKGYLRLKRKRLIKSAKGESRTSTGQADCSDCAADCSLRDASSQTKEGDSRPCKKNFDNSNCS
ncbi:hypothetical protein SAMN05444274_101487 [Mariniphaga anaerophila]|uniref:Uncharacterized protein n=1 Tax=Mariniphaga anaerophila TaxID=1484053 RepID=A0A1M4TVS6_9BACT|nr:hypothetical protein [Mariniphaga anaerophila]SHE48572.1 hypothetical protein SAMN05444274_101487 [Mariniphaga anaerophila]